MKEDPRELVKEHDENVLACPKTEKPVDLDSLGRQFAELFAFVREKVYDAQSKFDRTIIYLSGGAIALTYQLLLSNDSGCKLTLLCAIGTWAVSCVFSLGISMWRIGHETRVLNFLGMYVNVVDDYKFWKGNLKELDKVVKLAEHGFVRFDDGPGKAPSKSPTAFKECIEKIHKELAEESKKSQKAVEEFRTSYTSEWPVNLIQLALFVGGCVIFALYTYGNVRGENREELVRGDLAELACQSNVCSIEGCVAASDNLPVVGITNDMAAVPVLQQDAGAKKGRE